MGKLDKIFLEIVQIDFCKSLEVDLRDFLLEALLNEHHVEVWSNVFYFGGRFEGFHVRDSS